MIKFYYNGIRVNGKLNKALITEGVDIHGVNRICVYADDYEGFDKEIRDEFVVKNESDSMTDYFETDKFSVYEGHKHWEALRKVIEIKAQRRKRRMEKIEAKYRAIAA